MARAWDSDSSSYDFASDSDDDGTGWLHSADDNMSISFSSVGSGMGTAAGRRGTFGHRPTKRPQNIKKGRLHAGPSSSSSSASSTLLQNPTLEASTASPMRRVLQGQKKSTMIAEAAVRDASRLRGQVSAVEKRFVGVSTQLQGCLEREQALKMARGRDKLAAKELRYRNLYLAKELAQVKDAAKESAALTRAKMNGLANSLNTLEEGTASRARAVQREVRHLRGLLTSLQRRAVRGMGPAGSTSGERILTAMWQSVENILQLGVPGGVPAQSHVSSRRPYFSGESGGATSGGGVGGGVGGGGRMGGSCTGNGNDTYKATRDLAETMDGVVGDLERENQRLRAEVEMLQTEILHYKGKTESVALIPQYRQAVTRAREHAELLRQRLREEIDAKVRIEQELAVAQKEVRRVNERAALQIKKSVHNEKELAATNLRSAFLNQTMDISKEQFRTAYAEFASTTSQQQRVIDELQEVIAAQRNRLEELSGGGGNAPFTNIRSDASGVRMVNVRVPAPAQTGPNLLPPPTRLQSKQSAAMTESLLMSSSSDDALAMDDDDDDDDDEVDGNERNTFEINGGGSTLGVREGFEDSGTLEYDRDLGTAGGSAPGALNALHTDLAKLDAEIATLQSGILEATRRQNSPMLVR